jgi:hypothetical protein
VPTPEADEFAWLEYTDLALRRLVALQGVGRREPGASSESDLDPDGIDSRPEAELAALRERFLASLRVEGSGFGAMASNARLSEVECELVAFAVACELDVRRQRLVGLLQNDQSQGRLMLQTAGSLLGGLDRCPKAIGPDSRVRRAALLDVSGVGPWAQQTVEVPASLVWAFLGDNAPDPDLPHGTRLIEADDDRGADLVIVSGPDRVRRREAAIVATTGDAFLVSPVPTSAAGWAAVVREATMTGRGIVIELDGPLPAEGRRWIERADHLAWAITSPSELPIAELPDRPLREVEASRTELSADEWILAFGPDTPHTHRLTPQQVEQVSKVFGARDNDIDAAVRRLLAGPLESLAKRIRPRHSWNDLVLTEGRFDQLRSIVTRYRHSGQVYDEWGFSSTPSRGLVALFSGPSGTGKTLAAEVLASELGLDMFKLDLSSVVSKYIGETEKNLDQVFDAAGVGNVVLFFDEADSLFGKRSEVKDARDRYANIEVSYLLQRVEAFDGVVVLATNFEKSIDDAFLRRIHSRIEFVLPECAERVDIWKRHIPDGAPLGDLDFDWLASRFELSGGQIRNAAVQAAFTAAAAGTPIAMEPLVRGVAQELRKAGRLLKPADFGEWYPVVGG